MFGLRRGAHKVKNCTSRQSTQRTEPRHERSYAPASGFVVAARCLLAAERWYCANRTITIELRISLILQLPAFYVKHSGRDCGRGSGSPQHVGRNVRLGASDFIRSRRGLDRDFVVVRSFGQLFDNERVRLDRKSVV